jgi:hypothetical protein
MQIIDKNEIESLILLMGKKIDAPKESINYEKFEFEGQNKYRYLNLFDFNSTCHIPEEERDTFFEISRIISKNNFTMDLEGMCMINIANYPHVSISNLIEKLNPKYITLWGVDPEKLNLKIKLYGGALIDKVKIIRLDSLENTISDIQTRNKAETLLKMMFGLSK